MSNENYTSFFEEMKAKYKIEFVNYSPIYNCESGLILKLRQIQREQQCPKCASHHTIVHEYTNKGIREGTFNGVPVILNIKHCRYLCQECKSTFMERFQMLPQMKNITIENENYILSMIGTIPFCEIAKQIGTSTQTIVNRAHNYAENEKAALLSCRYKYLSMDEVFVSRNSQGESQYYWILNDISKPWKANNIRIEWGRKKEDVIKRLKELQHIDDIRAVSIDMWKPYRDAISEVLPNAAIVIDPFHVIKIAETAIDSVRKKTAFAKELKYDAKKDAKLFTTSLFKLTDEELIRLEIYLKEDKKLETAYFAVQELLNFYSLKDYDYALNYIASWESDIFNSDIKELKSLLNTIQNWLPYIMNYFIYRITNGKTEGKNHLLRVIDKMGFHYGLDSIQACIYAHDRKQEYKKWKSHQKKQKIRPAI